MEVAKSAPSFYIPEWRQNIETLIATSKLRAAINVNSEMLSLYWSIGKQIIEKQEQVGWGKQIIVQLSKDLTSRYPDDRGYSERNLRNMKRFALAYPNFPIWQVPLAKLKEQPILQATLAKLESEGNDFVQVPLAQISWTQPMGIAQYETEKLFADVASALPQIEEIEKKLEEDE